MAKFNRQLAFDLWLCAIAGILLGISQPIYIPNWFGEISNFQDWLGGLALIGYVPLFVVIAKKNLKSTFWLSFAAMTLQYTIVLYWIYIALHVHGHIPPIAAAIITLLLPMLLATLGGLFLVLARFLSVRFKVSFFLVVPFALCAYAYVLNFYPFGGFPWGNVGYSIGRIDQMLQVASLVGVYGLVFLVGLVNALFGLFMVLPMNKLRFRCLALAILIVIGCFIYGAIRLKTGEHEFAPSIRVALLQGNIPQELKSGGGLHSSDILAIYLKLNQEAKSKGAELVIWPETAYPRMLSKDVKTLGFDFADRVASVVGAVVYGDEPTGGYYVHNSALLLNNQAAVVKRYDKSHLVPFGEYVPWPLSGVVDRIVPGLGAFKPGTDFVPENLVLSESKRVSIGSTVCYEGIFPEISRLYAKGQASLLVNLTNDAWYGYSSAPYQHLLMYRMRSVESGLPFLRATNTGISAWIDVYGRVQKSLGLFKRGLIVDDVPLISKRTVYIVVGDTIPILSLLLLIFAYMAAVLPVHSFIKQRQWWKLLVIVILSAVAISSQIYFTKPHFMTDESAKTKILLIFLLCLLLMVGLLSKTKRSKSILLVCSVVIILCSIALGIFESPYFFIGIVLGLLIYVLAFRIKAIDKPVK